MAALMNLGDGEFLGVGLAGNVVRSDGRRVETCPISAPSHAARMRSAMPRQIVSS